MWLMPMLVDFGAIYVLHPSSQHVPNKTRAFADRISERFSRDLPWRR